MTRFRSRRTEREREEWRKYLKSLRITAGDLSQADVAEAAKLPMWRYQQIETGRGRPATDTEKIAIAKAIRKPIDEVFPVLIGAR